MPTFTVLSASVPSLAKILNLGGQINGKSLRDWLIDFVAAVRSPTPGASTAAAGTTTADAGVLPAATAKVYPTTAADGTKGVRVHADDKVTGRMLFIGNGVSTTVLKVYGPSGAAINGAAADAAFSGVSGKGVILYCLDATANTWLAW